MIFSSLPIGLAGLLPNIYYAAPLVVVISLVYGATRHEQPIEIIKHSFRSITWVVGFMAVIMAVIWLASFMN